MRLIRRRRKNRNNTADGTGLVSVADLAARPSRPRDSERPKRRRLAMWDRTKYVLLLAALFGVFWWQKLAENPIKSVADGFWETVSSQAWIWVLLAAELVRQLHFLIAENWGRYHRFWKSGVFGRAERVTERIDPWTRFRVGRVLASRPTSPTTSTPGSTTCGGRTR